MLFKDSKKIKEYAQLSGEINFLSIKATLRMVEQKHIATILGNDLYSDLDTAYTNEGDENNLSVPKKKLLLQCRMVIGPMLCCYYIDKADVSLGDAGAQRLETASNKTAFQYQGTKFKEANLREGEDATELLLQFLEDNKADYPLWTASNTFKQYRSLFIKTGNEFNELYPSQSPYRNYWAMRTKMLDVEEIVIRPFLGDTMIDALKVIDQTPAPAFTAKQKQLLFKLKKAIANYTVAFAVPQMNVRINANGLSVIATSSFSTNDNENTRSLANDTAINALIKSCNATGQEWITNATKYLKDNETDFPDWIGFSTITTIETTSPNADLKGTFGMA